MKTITFLLFFTTLCLIGCDKGVSQSKTSYVDDTTIIRQKIETQKLQQHQTVLQKNIGDFSIREDSFESFSNVENLPKNDLELKKWFILNKYDTTRVLPNDMILKRLKTDFQLDKNRIVDVYNIHFRTPLVEEETLPTGWQKEFILIIDKLNNEIAFLPCFEFISLDKYYFSGRYNVRDKSFFAIYRYENGKIIKKFDSSKSCYNGIYTGFFRDDDCIAYRPMDLKMVVHDFNNDGIRDISFAGIANFYCKKNESRDENSKKILYTKPIYYEILYDKSTQKWQMSEKMTCKYIELFTNTSIGS